VLPWGWRKQVPFKHWDTSTVLHGVTTQKTTILIFTGQEILKSHVTPLSNI
jgi:hypothetical protein